MASQKGREIYNSRRWQLLRLIVKRRDGYRCRACNILGGPLEIDHIKPLENGGEPFELSNVQCLCTGCHILKTTGERLRSSARLLDGQRLAWLQHIKKEV